MIGTLRNVARTVFCTRLSPRGVYSGCTSNITTCTNPLFFGTTNVLLAEPMKKKRKIDPMVIRQRDERKKKKIAKQIRNLEKFSNQLKPLDELDVPFKLIDEKEKRLRSVPPLSEEEADRRILLEKQWAGYNCRERRKDFEALNAIISSQQKALNELRIESLELYNEALQADSYFLPYSAVGPVDTPPIDNYDSPDGEYVDLTRKFEGEQ